VLKKLNKYQDVAGCGKTKIIAISAVNAFKCHSFPVLILTFNITLKYYIKDKVSDVIESIGFNSFEITNYHQFLNSLLNKYNIEINEVIESHRKKTFK
jgi:hypothetical protein